MKINVKNYKQKASPQKDEESKVWLSLGQFLKQGLSDKVKSRFYKELKVLLSSGITIEEGVSIIIKQTKNKSLETALKTIYKQLLKGKTLVVAMGKTNSFTPFEINTLAIGEETKNLNKVLEELEVFYKRKYELRNQVITVLTYPAFVIVITIAVLVFMLKNVVPMFEKVFRQFNSELPSLTRKIIYISNNFSYAIGFIFIFLFICFFVYFRFRKTDSYRKIASMIVLRIPFFGRMIKAVYLSRFCRALSLLLSSKVSLVESLNFVKIMIEFYPIESSIEEIKKDIIKGNSLGDSLKKHKVYDMSLVSMVKVSEEVNELDDMFNYLTEQYINEVDVKSKRIGALIEPFIIIIIGGLVGVIMIAMYLPMFDLSKILNSN
ncbi:type II secretion system F family protein [Tenacibaculum ovolyticum]|uniref:type II secretion system F family protein n=1 Tax=Tenacibaculum ovolyticum TaxID=104270 RepID=UPI0007ED7A0D|nr:type II secretion system F family protein [Tenacibaculum ovolyticum]WBX75087.1 type II secretion system F family protein [Tenacibaculum ovolyticum]